ncbi:MAG: hypothetical protein A2W31_17935 [Planctomycetes bacterium RBG_16_64_10]|nr:MAG: hypothetical protein A2W31_17935 [Planctomycetes bacterium RBG_16_64_10]
MPDDPVRRNRPQESSLIMAKTAAAQAAGGFLCIALLAPAPAHAQFNLVVRTSGFSTTQELMIRQAQTLWEGVITGYQPGVRQAEIDVLVTAPEIDGPGGMVGVAGPTGSAWLGDFVVTTTGSIQVDRDDLAGLELAALLADLVAHELGHILGIGTQWVANGVYVTGTGRYVGPSGLAAYRAEFDPEAAFVPVELDGGPGSADAHWDHRIDVLDPHNRPLADELMTGVASGDNYLSRTTVLSLRDIGFEVQFPGLDLAGDVNLDGGVNGLDVGPFFDALVQGRYLTTADVNRDGGVDGLDLEPFVAAVLGRPIGVAPAVVPEPATFALVELALLGFVGSVGRGRSICLR